MVRLQNTKTGIKEITKSKKRKSLRCGYVIKENVYCARAVGFSTEGHPK